MVISFVLFAGVISLFMTFLIVLIHDPDQASRLKYFSKKCIMFWTAALFNTQSYKFSDNSQIHFKKL